VSAACCKGVARSTVRAPSSSTAAPAAVQPSEGPLGCSCHHACQAQGDARSQQARTATSPGGAAAPSRPAAPTRPFGLRMMEVSSTKCRCSRRAARAAASRSMRKSMSSGRWVAVASAQRGGQAPRQVPRAGGGRGGRGGWGDARICMVRCAVCANDDPRRIRRPPSLRAARQTKPVLR